MNSKRSYSKHILSSAVIITLSILSHKYYTRDHLYYEFLFSVFFSLFSPTSFDMRVCLYACMLMPVSVCVYIYIYIYIYSLNDDYGEES